MSTFLTFTVVGVATGAAYAVIASGLVLTYTTTGVFNFAHGAIGMLAAFAYWQVHVDWGWSTWPALALVLGVLAPAFGLALERLMRGLQGTGEATRVVVSISILIGILGLAQVIWEPQVARNVPRFFGSSSFRVFDTGVSAHQLVVVAVAVVVAGVLRLLLYRVRIGVAMRAVVDDPGLADLAGLRTGRVLRLSWMVSTSLAALGGILVVSTAGLNAVVLSLLIVNAYAAAIFGRLRSLPLAFVGALVVGLTEAYLQGYLPQSDVLAGLRLASPMLVLFVVLLVIPSARLASHVPVREYFPAPTPRGLAIFAGVSAASGIVLAAVLSPGDVIVYGRIFPYAVIALSLVPLLGYANQLSLCQLSLAGIGAVTFAHVGGGGSLIGLAVAVLVTAVVGAVIALPALRLSGIHLALATAAFAVALDRWVFFLPRIEVGPFSVALFDRGSVGVAPLRVGSWDLADPRAQMVFAALVFAVLAVAVGWLRRGRFGRRLLAQRDSEKACASFGMGLIGTRVSVFACAAGIAGLGGALLGMQAGSAQPEMFSFTNGLPIFMAVAVGGAGFLSAASGAGVFLGGFFPFTSSVAPWFTRWQPLTIATVGVGLGYEPSGAAVQWRNGFRNLGADGPVLGALLVVLGVVGVTAVVGALVGWPLIVVLVGATVGATGVADVRAVRRGLTPSWRFPDRVERRGSREHLDDFFAIGEPLVVDAGGSTWAPEPSAPFESASVAAPSPVVDDVGAPR